MRALEIATLQGDAPLPAAGRLPGAGARASSCAVEPVEHRRRIAVRARAQFDAGLVEEARALRERFDPALPAFSAIGYRESWAVLDGELDLEAAIELDAARNVAVRQAPADLVPPRAGARRSLDAAGRPGRAAIADASTRSSAGLG